MAVRPISRAENPLQFPAACRTTQRSRYTGCASRGRPGHAGLSQSVNG
jgi:hypothetical protein